MSADAGSEATDRDMDALLSDPAKRAAILQCLGQLNSSRVSSHLTPSGMAGGGEIPTSSGSVPTLSGMFPAPYGAFPHPAAWYSFPPFPPMPQPLLTWPTPPQSSMPQATQALTGSEVTTSNDLDNGEEHSELEEGKKEGGTG